MVATSTSARESSIGTQGHDHVSATGTATTASTRVDLIRPDQGSPSRVIA